MNAPTAVFPGPGPSAIDSVAVFPLTVTAERLPPEGTLVSVHGAMPAVYGASVSSNTTVTVSTLPLASTSRIAIDCRTGGMTMSTAADATDPPEPTTNTLCGASVVPAGSVTLTAIEVVLVTTDGDPVSAGPVGESRW